MGFFSDNKMVKLFKTKPQGNVSADGKQMKNVEIYSVYQVIVECKDEVDQEAMYKKLTGKGLRCKILTLPFDAQ